MNFICAVIACVCFLGYAFGLDLGSPRELLGVGLFFLVLACVLPTGLPAVVARRD